MSPVSLSRCGRPAGSNRADGHETGHFVKRASNGVVLTHFEKDRRGASCAGMFNGRRKQGATNALTAHRRQDPDAQNFGFVGRMAEDDEPQVCTLQFVCRRATRA